MKKEVKSYTEFINETEQKVVYPTNFAGMVQGAISTIHSQIMAIAHEMAMEKMSRNPYRYNDTDNKVAGVEEVDISRAINLIFHSDWKKLMKDHNIQEWSKLSLERASTHDDRANKKNERARRTMATGGEDSHVVDLGTQGFSRDSGSAGEGSNR